MSENPNRKTGHPEDCPCVECEDAYLASFGGMPEWTAEDQARAEQAYREGRWASNLCPGCNTIDDQHTEECPCKPEEGDCQPSDGSSRYGKPDAGEAGSTPAPSATHERTHQTMKLAGLWILLIAVLLLVAWAAGC